MNISFSDIARVSSTMQEGDTLVVDKSGKIGTIGAHEVKLALPKDTEILSEDQFFKALEQQTDAAFATAVRDSLRNEKPLSARTIRAVVETTAHRGNLTAGLVARTDAGARLDALEHLIEGLRSGALGDRALPDEALRPLEKARAAVIAARRKLADVDGQFLVTHAPKKAEKLVGALVEAESDLAVSLRAFHIEELDDRSMEMELNAVHLEELTETLKALGAGDRDAVAAEFDRLLGTGRAGAPQPPQDLARTEEAVRAFTTAATPFLLAVAALDTAQDNAESGAALLKAIDGTYGAAKEALESLKTTPGIDQQAVKTLEANLVQMKKRCDDCRKDIHAKLQQGRLRELLTMLEQSEAAAQAHTSDIKYRDYRDIYREIRRQLETNLVNLRSGKQALVMKAFQDTASLISKHRQEAYDVGLHDFVPRVNRFLASLKGGAAEIPAEKLDVRLLGEVLRGEVDLMNYMTLKEEGYPPEMFRADLDGRHAVRTGSAGSGAFNSVDFYEIPNLRTGASDAYVVKSIESSQDRSALNGIADDFSDHDHARQGARLNYASWKGAHLIGCGSSITQSGLVRLEGRYQLVQEVAEGKSIEDTKGLFGGGIVKKVGRFTPAQQAEIRRELHIACAKLEWADWLSGQLDRTNYNVLLDISEMKGRNGESHIQVSLKGIDNDASFPERRPGLYTFLRPDKKTPYMTSDTFNRDHVRQLAGKGVRGMRRPIFLPRSVQEKLANLEEKDFRREMAPFLSADALKAAVSRLNEMKAAAASWPEAYVIDEKSDSATLDTLYAQAYRPVKHLLGSDRDIAGGFYGYMMNL